MAVASCTAVNAHTDPSTHIAALGQGADLQSVDVNWQEGEIARDGPSSLGDVSRASITDVSGNINMYHNNILIKPLSYARHGCQLRPATEGRPMAWTHPRHLPTAVTLV